MKPPRLTYADWMDGFVTACIEKDYPAIYTWTARADELSRFDQWRMRWVMRRIANYWDLRKAWRRITRQTPEGNL